MKKNSDWARFMALALVTAFALPFVVGSLALCVVIVRNVLG